MQEQRSRQAHRGGSGLRPHSRVRNCLDFKSQIDNGVAAQRAKGLQTSISEPCALAAANRRWLGATDWGGLRTAVIALIELVRGVPMLVALYVSSFIVPMMIPGVQVNLFVSVIASGFTAPYGRSRFRLISSAIRP
jgi:hypothetical protein